MHLLKTAAILTTALGFAQLGDSQQYAGDVIPNSLPSVPGSEITYFRVNDPSGANKNLTLINYYSHGKSTSKRLVESNVQRAVVIIHGQNRDPGTYMSNMLSALAQVKSDPNVNFDTVAIMAPYFPNGDDKVKGHPWTEGLKPGKGSTSNALVWKSSQWSAGANNQYPSTSKNISSYTVLDQVVQSYWVGNPNSYVWLSTDRPLSTAGCPAYDEYRDGYSAFEEYPMTYGIGLVASGRAAILANFNSKAINYGRGTQDLGDDSSTCAPRTTGKDRNERFFNFIKAFPPSCPDPAGRNCDTVDFVNIGHDGGSMMASPAGQARLFLDNFYGNGNRSYDFGYPRQQAGDDPYPNPGLNGTAATVNNNTYAGNMTYWGCWSDQSPQTLANMTYQSNANTIDTCTQACASGNNTIAGMEFGTQCFCGSSLGYRAQQVIESSCQFVCPGNSSQQCGGSNRLSLFSNGRPQLQPTPGTPETVGNFTYISCYTEPPTGRALGGKSTSSKSMTLEYCADYCSGYKYFGTEYGSECYCGNSFSAGANRTSDDDCNMLCANDVSEFCGAGNRLTVYQNDDFVASSSAVTSSGASSTSQPGSQPTAVSWPASNNTIVTSGGKSFVVECGIDHQGGDLTSLNVNNFQQCIDTCAQNGRCVDVSLSGNACYLKSVLGAAISNGGIWGAKLVTDPSSTASVTASSTATTSSSGMATSSAVTSSSATASSSATFSSTSTAFSGASSSSGLTTTSSLTTSSSLTSSSSLTTSDGQTSVTSATRTASASASSTPVTCPGSDNTTVVSNGVTFEIECGIDHFGGDMKSLSVSSFQQCIDACATTSGCVNVALSGAACYLKRTLGVAINNGVWGAKVVQASATSTSSASVSSSTLVTGSASVTSDLSSSSGVTTSSASSSSSSSSAATSSSASTSSSAATSNSASTSSTGPGTDTTASSSATSNALTSLSSVDATSTSASFSSATGSTSSQSQSTSSDSTSSNSLSSSSGSSSGTSSSSTTPASDPSTSSSASSSISVSTSMAPTSISSSTSSTSTLSSTQSTMTSSAQSSTSSGIPSTLPSSSAPTTFSSATLTTVSASTTSSSSSSTASAALPTGFTSLGCFVDSNARVLPQSNGSSSAQTPQQCAVNCQSRGFKYSGTEYGQECWCGSTPPQSSASAPTSQCNMRCGGDKGQMCGASNRVSVVMDNDWKQTFFARQTYSTWSLMGCYVDTNAARTLSKTVSLAAYGGSANATIANCMEACRAKGYLYCGQEYYSECYGSTVSPPEARLANGADPLTAGCNYPCNGNKTEACGGNARILGYVNNGTA